jgi:hypothetical protein
MIHRGSQLAAVVICFLILTVTTVTLRCYVRIRLTGGFGADDAFSVAALVRLPLNGNYLLLSAL